MLNTGFIDEKTDSERSDLSKVIQLICSGEDWHSGLLTRSLRLFPLQKCTKPNASTTTNFQSLCFSFNRQFALSDQVQHA